MRRSILLAAVMATLFASFAADAQQPMQRVQVGILECRGGSSVGFIVGSVTNLGCVLRADGFEDRYVATIRKVGLDLGIPDTVVADTGNAIASPAMSIAATRRRFARLNRAPPMSAFTMFEVSAACTLFRKLEASCPVLPIVSASSNETRKMPIA